MNVMKKIKPPQGWFFIECVGIGYEIIRFEFNENRRKQSKDIRQHYYWIGWMFIIAHSRSGAYSISCEHFSDK